VAVVSVTVIRDDLRLLVASSADANPALRAFFCGASGEFTKTLLNTIFTPSALGEDCGLQAVSELSG